MNYVILISFFIFLSLNFIEVNADNSEILILESKMMKMIDELDFNEAQFYIDEILKIDPYNENALNNKGGIFIKTGNYAEAITYFDRVLSINENSTEALNNKAIALANQIQYTEALRLFHKSLLIDSSDQVTVNNTKNLISKLKYIDETEKSYATITVRDQNGNIVGNSRSTQVIVQPPLGYMLLEQEGILEEIEIDGVVHKKLEFKETIPITKNQYVGRGELTLKIDDVHFRVLELILNGLIVTAGDTIEYNLVIFDPTF